MKLWGTTVFNDAYSVSHYFMDKWKYKDEGLCISQGFFLLCNSIWRGKRKKKDYSNVSIVNISRWWHVIITMYKRLFLPWRWGAQRSMCTKKNVLLSLQRKEYISRIANDQSFVSSIIHPTRMVYHFTNTNTQRTYITALRIDAKRFSLIPLFTMIDSYIKTGPTM